MTPTHQRIAVAMALCLAASVLRAQSIVAQWNFNNSTNTPTAGTGSLSTIGGVSTTFASGAGSSDPTTTGDNAWSLAAFPTQSTAGDSAGIELRVDSTGFKNLDISFDLRASNTASRRVNVLCAPDGLDFVPAGEFEIVTGGVFTNALHVNLSGVEGSSHSPNLRVRIVSGFTDGGVYQAISGNYSAAGTWRIDMLTVTGTPEAPPPTPPRVVRQPASIERSEGASARFVVTARGTAPLAYQWLHDDVELPGATGPELTLSNVTPADSGSYRVRVTNAEGETVSDAAVLTVTPLPDGAHRQPIAAVRRRIDPVKLTPTNTVESLWIEGVVTSPVNLASVAADSLCFIQDDSGGIGVLRHDASGAVPAPGSRIRVIGSLNHLQGLLVLELAAGNPEHRIELLSDGDPLPPPAVLDPTWLDVPAAHLEALEGSRVSIASALLDTTSARFPGAAGGIVQLTLPGARRFPLRVDGRINDIAGQTKPVGTIAVSGLLVQADTTDPRTTNYQILPTAASDLRLIEAPPTLRFTNRLSHLVRPGDATVHSFKEIVVHPGETLDLSFEADVPTGGLLNFDAARAEATRPPGSHFQFEIQEATPPGATTGRRVSGHLGFTPTTAAAGTRSTLWLSATNASGAAEIELRIHVPNPAEQQLVLTEFLANPTSDSSKPWFNPLGRIETPASDLTAHDEFVELVNFGNAPLDLGGWSVSDGASVRHRFPTNTVLGPGAVAVVYGGPLTGFEPAAPPLNSIHWFAASEGDGLSLNNTGDTLLIHNRAGDLVHRVVYAAADLAPQGSVARASNLGALVPHRTLGERFASPGFAPDGTPWRPQATGGGSFPIDVALEPANTPGQSATVVIRFDAQPTQTYRLWHAPDVAGPYEIVDEDVGAGEFRVGIDADNATAQGWWRVSTP